MAVVFFSYSHADEAMRDQIEKQLAMLKRQGAIETWHDRRIDAGDEWAAAIDERVEHAEIILLLVSADFLASNYCYEKEMLRAVERHNAGEAVVIPIILRACDWHPAPFGKIQATPKDGKPITQWPDLDEALLQVAKAVRKAAERFAAPSKKGAEPVAASKPPLSSLAPISVPRSSNLRLAKQFSERDKDNFRLEAFDYIARYFENSLAELETRNAGIEGTFRRIDANRFTASVYRNGTAIARCTIFMSGNHFGNGVAFVQGETDESNSLNDCLTVEADDQALFLRGMQMGYSGRQDGHLTMEGGAELYWGRFIEPLQRR